MADTDLATLLGSAANVGTGLYSLFGSGAGSAKGAAATADPFASQRGQYQGMLQGLMTNPGSYSLSPAAQFQMSQGTQNLERSAAAKGYLGSGNLLAELQQFGQGVASQDYWKQAQLLEQLSGANQGSPAAAAQLGQQGFGQGLGSIGQGLPGLISGAGSLGSSLASLFSGAGTPTNYSAGALGSGLSGIWDAGSSSPLDLLNSGGTGLLDTGYDLGSGLSNLGNAGDWSSSISDLWSAF